MHPPLLSLQLGLEFWVRNLIFMLSFRRHYQIAARSPGQCVRSNCSTSLSAPEGAAASLWSVQRHLTLIRCRCNEPECSCLLPILKLSVLFPVCGRSFHGLWERVFWWTVVPTFSEVFFFLTRGKGKERLRETSMCGCLSHVPYWGPGLQPRHVPWLGIELVTLWFAVQCSIHWVTPDRA